jgi:hypothetical protein
MNKQRRLLDRHGKVVRVGDIVKWEQESGDKLLILTGKIISVDDYVRVETSKGDVVELLWPYDLPDAEIEKVNSKDN